MELITGQTAPGVWLSAVEYLCACDRGEDFDVFLHVEAPLLLKAEDDIVYEAVDSFLKTRGAFGVHTIAETIFPLSEYRRRGAKGVFEDFPEKVRSIQKARYDGNWGSYAYRILRQRDKNGEMVNPLADLVEKIRKHGKYRASYELGQGLPFDDDIAIYDPLSDRKRLYGGPCLSHLSIKVHDGKVRMNATYRAHYYVRRLLGNLVGLGRLQYFIAKETGLQVGGLTINSTFARLDTGSGDGTGGRWTKAEVLSLIKHCRKIYDSTVPEAA